MCCRAAGQQAGFAERPGQKIVLERQLPDLRMQGPHVHDRGSLRRGDRAEDAGGAFQKLRAPLRDLVWVNIELLGQLGQRLLASDGRQCHFRFEGRAVVPPWSSGHGALLALGNHADNARIIHSSPLSRFPEPPL